jgi:hypothetical protein
LEISPEFIAEILGFPFLENLNILCGNLAWGCGTYSSGKKDLFWLIFRGGRPGIGKRKLKRKNKIPKEKIPFQRA